MAIPSGCKSTTPSTGKNCWARRAPFAKPLRSWGPAFFVLYGDSYLVCDYRGVQQNFEQEFLAQNKLALMTVFRNAGKWDRSNVEFSAGRLLAYDKKNWTPRMQFIDYGLGVFSEKAFVHLRDEPFDLAQLYMNLLGEGQLAGMEVCERFYEIGSPAGLQETAQFLSTQGAGLSATAKKASRNLFSRKLPRSSGNSMCPASSKPRICSRTPACPGGVCSSWVVADALPTASS